MSIDDYAGGPGLGAASLLLRNDDTMWPEFRGRDLRTAHPATRFALLAEDGATSVDLERAVFNLPRPRDDERVLVTITTGGNDLLHLAASPDPLARAADVLAAFTKRLDGILARLKETYRRCVVLLSTVYDPTDGTGKMQSGHDVSFGLPLLTALNDTLRAAAARHGARLIDTHDHFLGHGVRHRDPSFAHYHANDPSGWFVFDIEPNARGSSELRRLFLEALE